MRTGFIGQIVLSADPVAFCVSAVELLSLGLALHYRVHCLQVRWVGHQRQGDVAISHAVYPSVIQPQMILHIA